MDFLIAFISGAIVYKIIKSILRKTKTQPKRNKQQQTDELITVVLPTIKNDR